jgi:hypothetical protein
MKKIILLAVLNIFSVMAFGQYPATTLSQNFDGVCASSTSVPMSWSEYTPAHLSTYPQGSWSCSATHGRGGSGGMQCTDTFSNADHMDTSFLLTPLLLLSSYAPGHVYLQFDTKTSNILLGGDLTILHVTDSVLPDTPGAINLTPGMTPVFTNGDSTDWVTHVIDLTPYESTSPFYIAFMFTSTATTGSIWFLDNVLLTTHNITLHEPELNAADLKMSIIGMSSPNLIQVGITNGNGDYQMALTDMTGRVIYKEQVNVPNLNLRYSIKGLNLAPGMYFLKMGNGQSFDVTKVVVQ